MSNKPLPILYRDPYLIAVHKPPGLLVHRSWVASQETVFALQRLRNQIGRHIYPVHRLDRGTSGVLLFALDAEVAGLVAELFRNGDVQKNYLAIVRGYTPLKGEIDKPLKGLRDKKDPRGDIIEETYVPAVTHFTRLATIELPVTVDKYPTSRYSLLALCPQTGRRHQLRRHMKSIAHPLIGDTRYGKATHNRFFRQHYNCHRLLLAARELRFIHPVTGTGICLQAMLTGAFRQLIECWGWEDFTHSSPLFGR